MSTTVDLGKITASVTVGTTTTGAAGTNASVSNSGTTQDAVLNFTIPRGAQGVQGPQGVQGNTGPAGPTGPQGPMGDVAVITPEQQAAFTMYSETGQNTNGPMTQKAVTDNLVAGSISYDNSQSGLASQNVQGALDELGQRAVIIDSDNIIGNYSDVLGYFFPDSNNIVTWRSNNNTRKHRAIPISGGGYVKVVAGNNNAKVAFATSSYTTPTSSSHNSAVPLSATDSTMHSVLANTTNILPIPDDCAYILVDVTFDGGTIYTPQAVYLGTGIEDEVVQFNDLRNIGLLNIHFDGKGTAFASSDKFYGVAGHILKFTLVNQNVPYDSISSVQSRFLISSYNANGVQNQLYRINGTNLPDEEIIVVVPDDSAYMRIGGRCSRGYKYECKVIDITYDYHKYNISENDLYYHLAGNPMFNYRINLLLPYQDNMVVKIHPKVNNPTHQWNINAVKVNSDKTATTTVLAGYDTTYIDYVVNGDYSFVLLIFKETDNEEVDKSTLLQEYDIQVDCPEAIEEWEFKDGEKKWNLIGLSKISNLEAKTDFIVFPNLPMKVRMDIPVWFKVSFTKGNRSNRVDLGTYYSGDIVDFPQGSAGVFVDFKRLDDRGFDGDFYTRQSKFSKMSLTQIGSNDGNIFERNFDNEKNLGGIMATATQTLQYFPTIVHVTDPHGDAIRLKSAHDYADYILADLVVNTGDNPFFAMTDGVNFVKDIVFAHNADFANCIGNHDQYTSTLAEVFALNISPFATEYGYHKSTSSDVTDKCYYFKDLSEQKIRLIALDIYEDMKYVSYKARVSQTQINWFISTLASTPQDYGVIVIMHQAPHTVNAISGKANFNDITMDVQTNAIDSNYMQNGKITGNPFGKIVDAFITKGSVSGSYTQKKATSTTNETISYSADFSNVASGVEFIAYLNGHTHRDFIGYVADCENNQLNCNLCSTTPLSQTTGYGTKSDIYRDANGVSQDAFNVYTIDRYNHRLGVCRIGSNLSLNLIDRKVMWFDYV